MPDNEITERLDTIIALINLAFAESIERAKQELMTDPVATAVVDALSGGPLSAGDLKQRAADSCGQSERTVSRRISSLTAQKVIEQSGSGPRSIYRATGLFNKSIATTKKVHHHVNEPN